MTTNGNFKALAARVSMRMAGAYLRSPFSIGKKTLWNRLCVPYLSWRSEEIVCSTWFGYRMTAVPKDFIENRLLFFGIWEPAITPVFASLIREGDVVVDVGANVGYYTMLASKLVGPTGKVYAVEGSPVNRMRLEANLSLNKVENVTVLPYAAWSGPGTVKFYTAANRGGSGLRGFEDLESVDEVESRRLDDMICAEDLRRIRLIKMDIEGAELHAFRGFETALAQSPELAVIVEVDPENLAAMDSSADQLFSLFKHHRFTASRIEHDERIQAYLQPGSGLQKQSQISDVPCKGEYVLFQREALSVRTAQEITVT